MPDDEGRRRRLGDETKNRIADLASGWSLDGPDDAPAPVPDHTPKPAPPTRPAPRTTPPPPPGSAARKALDDRSDRSRAVTSEHASSASGRISKPVVEPEPKPSDADASQSRGGPQYKRAGYQGPAAPFQTESKTFAAEPHTPAVIVDETLSGPIKAVAAPSNSVPAEPSKPTAVRAEPPKPTAPPSRPTAPPSRPSAPPSRPTPAPLGPPPDAKIAFPLPAANSSSVPGLKVPVGEFDSGVQTLEQAALPRASTDLLEEDEATPPPPRDDPTMIDPQTAKFLRDDSIGTDPTQLADASMRLRHQSGGTLRPSAALRRKRGLAGDVRYVLTVMLGVRATRRELAELEHRQGLRQTSRRRHLVTLGRTAVVTDSLDHPALAKAREQLQAIEDERSRHAGAVTASDAELDRLRRDRDAKIKQYINDLAATDAELAELQKKLEPVEKEATSARKRAQELRESLQRITKKITETELMLASPKNDKVDRVAVQADLATYKADRQSIQRDEPVLAAELDALEPRIAALESARAELRRKRTELEKAELEDQRRTSELLEAIGAKRKVVERAASDAEAARDTALFELGERLYVDRPKILAAQLAPIDQIDLEVGEGDRRAMELKEILSNVDKAKLARGLAMIILLLGAVGSIVWLAMSI